MQSRRPFSNRLGWMIADHPTKKEVRGPSDCMGKEDGAEPGDDADQGAQNKPFAEETSTFEPTASRYEASTQGAQRRKLTQRLIAAFHVQLNLSVTDIAPHTVGRYMIKV